MSLSVRVSLVIALCFASSADAQYTSASEALEASRQTGKPIFAISTSPTCPPCRQLKQTVHTDLQVRELLEQFVVLEMQSSSADFAKFQQRFPGEYFGVPMVHVISRAGETLYARSGNLPADQLEQLLSYAVAKREPLNKQPSYSEELEIVRAKALKGDLADALQDVVPIADVTTESHDATVARAYRDQLESAICEWLDDLGQGMRDPGSQHSAAYRLAKLFTELPRKTKSSHKAIGLIRELEKRDATRTAMLQAKALVRARLEEERKMCAEAISTYENVIRLGARTPSGQYAFNRIPILRERQQVKLTSHQ